VKIAVLVPCYNEEAAIATVVRDFRSHLPDAVIYVYDNNSKDQTMARAREAGAVVRSEMRQGKGNVVRRMFADIEADLYLLVDGDDTYDAAAAPAMIAQAVAEGADLLTAKRIHTQSDAYRPGHVLGNKMLTGLTSWLFHVHLSDMLSGYRVFSRRFVKTFPLKAEGFAIETEFTVHAVRLMMPLAETDTRYKERPVGSVSKLNTWRDGFRILGTILKLYRSEKPLRFFTIIGLFLALVAIGLAIPLAVTYLEEGLVPRLPTAILSTGLMIVAVLSVSSGLVLDTVTRGRREMKLLAYLAQPPVGK
jgi:glycosyltransferase involved in cell wall biosynthesis